MGLTAIGFRWADNYLSATPEDIWQWDAQFLPIYQHPEVAAAIEASGAKDVTLGEISSIPESLEPPAAPGLVQLALL